MREISGTPAKVRSRERVEPLSTNRTTLREHYAKKKARYGLDHPSFYDRDLRKVFPTLPEGVRGRPAATILRKNRRELRRRVARWTGEYQYTIDQVLMEMIERCEELDVRTDRADTDVAQDALMLLTVQTMNYLHGGHHRLAR